MFNPSDVRRLVRLATTRTGNPVFDEDLLQEASVRALDAFRRAGQVAHPRAFLMKVVGDTVRDHWRRRRPAAEDLASIDERFVCCHPHFEDDIDRQRRAARLRAALSTLDPERRRVLRLFYEEEISIPEIARRENSSVPAVKMQLLRARRQLARIVRTNGTKKSR